MEPIRHIKGPPPAVRNEGAQSASYTWIMLSGKCGYDMNKFCLKRFATFEQHFLGIFLEDLFAYSCGEDQANFYYYKKKEFI